jgi:RNA polymerase sigma-70 factor (family 1)
LDSRDTDKDLFERISNGDEAAFTTIYKKYNSPLYFYATKILKSELWADEIVQEIFLNLWTNRSLVGVVANPGGYLNRMVVNKCVDWIRRHELDIKAQYYISNYTVVSESFVDAQQGLKEAEKLYKKAISLLPAQRRTVFKLRYEETLSYDQIADKLNISPHTVRNHLAKSLEFVRGFLLKYDIFLLIFFHPLLYLPPIL